MKLNDLIIENPQFGYRTSILLPFHFSKLGNGETHVYDDSSAYDRLECSCDAVLSKLQMAQFIELYDVSQRGQAILLDTNENPGFYPFTPVVSTDVSVGEPGKYWAHIANVRQGSPTNIAAKFFDIKFDLIYMHSDLTYNTAQVTKPIGGLSIGESALEVSGIQFPSRNFEYDIEFQSYPVHNLGGKVYGVWYGGVNRKVTSLKLTVDEAMCNNVLLRLLHNYRANPFNIGTSEGYYLFGVTEGEDSTYKVRLTNDSITVRHRRFNDFEINFNVEIFGEA